MLNGQLRGSFSSASEVLPCVKLLSTTTTLPCLLTHHLKFITHTNNSAHIYTHAYTLESTHTHTHTLNLLCSFSIVHISLCLGLITCDWIAYQGSFLDFILLILAAIVCLQLVTQALVLVRFPLSILFWQVVLVSCIMKVYNLFILKFYFIFVWMCIPVSAYAHTHTRVCVCVCMCVYACLEAGTLSIQKTVLHLPELQLLL